MKTAALMLMAILSAISASAQFEDVGQTPIRYYPSFVFTRTDGSKWQCDMTAPGCNSPTYLGQDMLLSNTQTNAPYHSWAIDPLSNSMLMDGVVVGTLNWNNQVVDCGIHFGFAVDRFWRGYLLCEQDSEDPYSYLFQVDVTTGNCTLIGVVGFGNPSPVTGMYGVAGDF